MLDMGIPQYLLSLVGFGSVQQRMQRTAAITTARFNFTFFGGYTDQGETLLMK